MYWIIGLILALIVVMVVVVVMAIKNEMKESRGTMRRQSSREEDAESDDFEEKRPEARQSRGAKIALWLLMTLLITGLGIFCASGGWIAALISFVVMVYLATGFRGVEDMHFALRYFLNKMVGKSRQGLAWAPPWPFGSVEEYPAKPVTLESEVVVNTSEISKSGEKGSNQVKLSIKIPVSPDFKLLEIYHTREFREIQENLLREANEQLTIFSGQIGYAEFIDGVRAFSLMLNCFFRLEITPHHHPEKFEWAGEVDSDGTVALKNRARFYTECHHRINVLLRDEDQRQTERSPIERRYGIDIGNVTLNAPQFSEEMKRALEKEREAEKRLAVVPLIMDAAKRFRAEGGLSPEEANDSAMAIVTGKPPSVYRMRGGRGDLWITPENENQGGGS